MIKIYKIGDYLVYKKDVCKVIDINKNGYKNLDYYVLLPINDSSLKIEIPISLKSSAIRGLLSKKEVEDVINEIPNVPVLDLNTKNIESEYISLLNSGNHIDLIKIIKTTYLRNKEREDSKKKISDKDKYYFEKAERYLYSEFSIVLNKSYEETKEYVVSKVKSTEE